MQPSTNLNVKFKKINKLPCHLTTVTQIIIFIISCDFIYCLAIYTELYNGSANGSVTVSNQRSTIIRTIPLKYSPLHVRLSEKTPTPPKQILRTQTFL